MCPFIHWCSVFIFFGKKYSTVACVEVLVGIDIYTIEDNFYLCVHATLPVYPLFSTDISTYHDFRGKALVLKINRGVLITLGVLIL
mgnify:CR=1 FL=1